MKSIVHDQSFNLKVALILNPAPHGFGVLCWDVSLRLEGTAMNLQSILAISCWKPRAENDFLFTDKQCELDDTHEETTS